MPDYSGSEYDWMRESITLDEFYRLRELSRNHSVAYRQSPTGQFVMLDLLAVLLNDYGKLRGFS